MAWTTGTSSLYVDVYGKVINVKPYQSDTNEEDVVFINVVDQDTQEVPAGVYTKFRDDNGNLIDLSDRKFYTSIPGLYEIDFVATDNAGTVLKFRRQSLKIVPTFRRYIVPFGYVILDLDKPIDESIDEYPTIHVLNKEKIEFNVLHAEPEGDPNRSSAYLSLVAPSDANISASGVGTETAIVYFDLNDSEFNETELINSVEEPYADRFITPNVAFDPPTNEDRRVLSLINKPIRIRIWKNFVPSKVPQYLAPVDDNRLARLLSNIYVTDQPFEGVIRVKGATNEQASTLHEGEIISTAFSQVSSDMFAGTITFSSYEDRPQVIAGSPSPSLSPKYTPPISQQFSQDLVIQTNYIYEVLNTTGSPMSRLGLKPLYHWRSFFLDSAARFRLNVLPLSFDPVDIPVVDGFYSVVPVAFYIEDTLDSSQNSNCPYPVIAEFSTVNTEYGIFNPGVHTYRSTIPTARVYAASDSNPLECGVVYMLWIKIPGKYTSHNETLRINGHDVVTFSLKGFNLTLTGEEMNAQALRFLSMGNFCHFLDPERDLKGTLYRSVWLTNNLPKYYFPLGNNADATLGYNFNEIHQVFRTAYWLASVNWNSCIDNWIDKWQSFLESRNFDSSFLKDVTTFKSVTDDGFAGGLPFGMATAYFTGEKAMYVDPNVVSLMYMVNYWNGLWMLQPLVKDWKGNYRVVSLDVYKYAELDAQELNDYGPVGLWMKALADDVGFIAEIIFQYWDVFWLSFAINARGLTEKDFGEAATDAYLIDPDTLVVYDPLSPTLNRVVDRQWNSLGTYEENAKLQQGTTAEDVGYVQITGEQQIFYGYWLGRPEEPTFRKVDWTKAYNIATGTEAA